MPTSFIRCWVKSYIGAGEASKLHFFLIGCRPTPARPPPAGRLGGRLRRRRRRPHQDRQERPHPVCRQALRPRLRRRRRGRHHRRRRRRDPHHPRPRRRAGGGPGPAGGGGALRRRQQGGHLQGARQRPAQARRVRHPGRY